MYFSYFQLLRDLSIHISWSQKKKLIALFFFLFFGSILEVISIGSIFPLLSLYLDPDRIRGMEIVISIERNFGNFDRNIVGLATGFFIFLVSLTTAFRVFLLWYQMRVSQSLAASFSEDIFQRILRQPYSYHLNKNSSELITAVSVNATSLVNYCISPIFLILNGALVLVMIIFMLAYIDFASIFFVIVVYALFYILVSLKIKKKLYLYGDLINRQTMSVLKIVQEALGGIRDVLIENTQKVHLKDFSERQFQLLNAKTVVHFLGGFPRHVIELLGIIVISLIAYYLSNEDDKFFIPILASYAMAAQRALPILQQVYYSLTQIRAGVPIVRDAINYLNLPINNELNLDNRLNKFDINVEIKGVSFGYLEESTFVLKDINLDIKKGDIVGLCGPTGSGKSTLIDLLLGLNFPSDGFILIDGKKIEDFGRRSWHAALSHVPQHVYLSDSSITENIALGFSIQEIDMMRVEKSAKLAELHDSILNLPNQYNTLVGERGARLSGGQRQRLGIARALYKKNASILILDEATSALDIETESKVLNSIINESDYSTVVMVTHRPDTLRFCDKTFEVRDGLLIQTK